MDIKEIEMQAAHTLIILKTQQIRHGCDKCTKSYTRKHHLKAHLRKHTDKNVADIMEECKGKSKIKWSLAAENGISIPFDGIPFISAGYKIYHCHQGTDVDTHTKEKREQVLDDKEDHDHTFRKRRRLVQSSKKLGCPAMVSALRKIKFPQYKIDFQPGGKRSRYQADNASRQLRNDISIGKKFKITEEYFLKLPSQASHQFHVLDGEGADVREPIDPHIVQKVCELGHIGVRSIDECQRHLANYVQNELFRGQSPPPDSRRRYNPKKKDIRNILQTTRRENKNEQSDVEFLCKEWATLHPNDSIFYRPAKSTDGVVENLLFVYQSDWMKRLLLRYGQDMCLIDATYRTCRYALPLFFLCVRTNVCYIVVATFIIENEDKESIKEALNIIKIFNPLWKPRNTMSDFSLAEIGAIEECFPDTHIHVCDFHREKAWTEWVAKIIHGVTTCKDEVLHFLREIANSRNENIMNQNIKKLKESEVWKISVSLQKYFTNFWELHLTKWVKHYRENKLQVAISTNNGIERQNRWLKSSYLERRQSSSLFDLVNILFKQFLPDSYKKYRVLNLESSSSYKLYSNTIPQFLHDRPKYIVKHIMDRMPTDPPEDVEILKKDDIYIVHGSDGERKYDVYLGSAELLPSCQCMDFRKNKIPCRHICAVISKHGIGWESLGSSFKEHPLFQLDPMVLSPDSNTEIIFENKNIEENPPKVSNVETTLKTKCITNLEQRTRNECLRNMKYLTDGIFRIQDAAVLSEVNSLIEKAISIVRRDENADGLPLGEKCPLPQRKKKKMLQKKKAIIINLRDMAQKLN